MALNSTALQSWLISHAVATVEVATPVLDYEPKSKIDYSTAAGKPVAAGWLGPVRVAPGHGGLNATSARVGWILRLHLNAFATDQGATERVMLDAADALMDAYFGDFEISGQDASFDPKGAYGEAVTLDHGYLDIDKQLSRVCTIALGVVVSNAWVEVP